MEPTRSLYNKHGFGIDCHVWVKHDKNPSHAEIQTSNFGTRALSIYFAFWLSMLNKECPFRVWRFTHTYLATKREGQRYCFIDFDGLEIRTDANEWKAGIVIYQGEQWPCSHYVHTRSGRHFFTWGLGSVSKADANDQRRKVRGSSVAVENTSNDFQNSSSEYLGWRRLYEDSELEEFIASDICLEFMIDMVLLSNHQYLDT